MLLGRRSRRPAKGYMKRVLLVDDMLVIRALVRVYLMEFGFDFVEARNGEEGLTLARHQRPDLIITDLQMPVMDGAEFLRLLRADPALEAVPVIVLSTGESASSPPGPTRFERKPVEPEALKEAVRLSLGL